MKQEPLKKVIWDTKTVMSVFMLGSGAVLWVTNWVFNPINDVKTDIALIQKDIEIINTNHEAHIQDMLTEIKKIKEDEVILEKDLAITNQVLLDHLNK